MSQLGEVPLSGDAGEFLDGTGAFSTPSGAASPASTYESGGADPITHNNLAGLTTGDPHTQYAALAGRAGGTIQYGGTASGNSLKLRPNPATTVDSVLIERGADGEVLAEFKNSQIKFHRDVYPGTAGRAFVRFNTVPSATTPNLIPADNASGTGVGAAGTGALSLIASSLEVLRASAAAGGVSAGAFSLVPTEANVAVAASPNLLAAMESGAVLTNEGATAENCHTLPTAAAGYRFTFICQDGDGIKISANSGDTIRSGATVSVPAGYIRSSVVGSVVTLISANSTEWFVISLLGTWTIDT
jgi:hypothetical protein